MKIKVLTILAAIIVGLCINPVQAGEVASIDVQKVVNSSPKVQALKKEQQTKAKELLSFIDKARKEVANVSDTSKKQSLEEKYNKQLAEKKQKMDKEYAEKLKKIEDEISTIISDQAKAKGYDMVVAKGVVLYSTNDITEDVVKAVKSAK